MRKGAKAKKKRICGNDIFINLETKELVRVMAASKEHTKFGDLRGTIRARPFNFVDGEVPFFFLHPNKSRDFDFQEDYHVYVRPSATVVLAGERSKATGLRVFVDLYESEEVAALLVNPVDIYQDTDDEDDDNLEALIGRLPMFVNELPLIDQIVKDFGNILAVSPIVHCELAGRGVEYANGHAKYYYRNKCKGEVPQSV